MSRRRPAEGRALVGDPLLADHERTCGGPTPPTSLHLDDLTATTDGLISVADRFGGGPCIFERTA